LIRSSRHRYTDTGHEPSPKLGFTPLHRFHDMRSNNGRRLERNGKFVDSPLERNGFELPVPRQIGNGFEASSKSKWG